MKSEKLKMTIQNLKLNNFKTNFKLLYCHFTF